MADAVAGGVTAVLARPARADTLAAARKAGALALAHRDVDLALACGADGVHTGHGGQTVEALRARAPGLLVGRSCHWPVTDEDRAADYVFLSPFRPTPHSHPRPLLTPEQVGTALADNGLGAIVALGGLTAADVPDLPRGLAGVAVVRAIDDAPDAREAAAGLRLALEAR